MCKYRLLIILFFISVVNVHASDNKILLDEVDQLMASGKILDAFKTLEKADPQNKDLDVFLIKLNLALNFYAVQLQFENFGFTNILPKQSLDQIRKQSGKYDLYPLKANDLIDSFIKIRPEEPILYKVKSDFLYEIYLSHDKKTKIPEDSLKLQLEASSRKAIELKSADYETFFVLGFLLIGQNKFDEAQRILKSSVVLNPHYPPSFYNLAYAEYMLKNYDKAISDAKISFDLYQDKQQKVDPLRLISYAFDIQSKTDSALFYLNKALELSPKNAEVLLDELYIYIRENLPNQEKLVTEIILLDPESPEVYNSIIQAYQSKGKNYQTVLTILTDLQKVYPQNDKIMGNTNFYQGQILFETDIPEAKKHFLSAQKYFLKVLPKDHDVFGVIDMYLNSK
jgi:tetratricopeptide (TPR) repeat protein